MPTYTCTCRASRLTDQQKAALAREVTRVHHEVTGAPAFFAEVIFTEVPDGDWFVGGAAVDGDQLLLLGHIRAGRSAETRETLITRLAEAVAEVAAVPARAVWVYLVELPARAMVEYGRVLPEPGEEAGWS